MRLGIIGTGLIVHEVLPLIHTLDLEKTYILGTTHSVEKTKGLCEEYHLDGCFFDYDELLSGDTVDTVYIAIPNNLHFSFAMQALDAGKHVIVEKPATVTVGELSLLAEKAHEKKKILVEAMSLHYTPAYQSIRERLGGLGRIRLVNFQFCQYSSRYDAFKAGQIAPAFDPKCAGGALMDLNIYNIHAIVGLFGKSLAVHYYPNMERVGDADRLCDADDREASDSAWTCRVDTSGILVMQYPDFQAVAVAAKDCQAPVSSTIQGEAGCIRIGMPMNRIDSYELFDNSRNGGGTHIDFHENVHRLSYEFRAFKRMIETEDFETAEKMLEISKTALETVEEARKFSKIVKAL